MEYVLGGTLADRLQGGPLLPRQAVQWLAKIARAGDAAHRRTTADGQIQPLIHRDLKLGNILLDAAGHPKIADFGLAVRYDRQGWGESAGTLAYMSPEQIRGQDLEPRSDLWSLGAIFYQMLTGRPPFPKSPDDDTDELKKQIQTSAHLAARGVKPDVPEVLSRICDRCLEKSPDDHYPTAAGLAGAIEQWLADPNAALPGGDVGSGLPHSIPDNLPPRVESFVGRTRELKDLGERLHRPGVVGEFRDDAALAANRSAVEFVVDQWFDGWAIGLTVVGAYMQVMPQVTWDGLAQTLQRKGVGAVRAVEQWVDQHGARRDVYEQRIDVIFSDLWQTLDPRHRRALEYAAIFPQDQLVRWWLIDLLASVPSLELDESLPGGRAAYAERTVESLEAMDLFRVAGVVPIEPSAAAGAADASTKMAVADLASTIRDPETCVATSVQVEADSQPVPEGLELLGFHRALRRLVRELGADRSSERNALEQVAALALERAKSCSNAIVNKPARAELGPLAVLASELIEWAELTLGARLLNWLSEPLRLLARATELDLPFRRLADSPGFEELAPDLRGTSLNNYALALSDLGGRENLEAVRARMEQAIAIELQYFDASHPTLATSYNNLGHHSQTLIQEVVKLRQ